MAWKKQNTKWILHHIIPFWNPVPFLQSKEINFFKWLRMKKSLNFAWVWGYKNTLFNQLSIKYPEKYLILRLEDITSANLVVRDSSLLKLASFLGSSEHAGAFKTRDFSFDNKVNASEKTAIKPTDFWSDTDKLFFHKYCQSIAEQYEY